MKPETRSRPRVVVAYIIWIIITAGLGYLLISGRTALLVSLSEYSETGFTQKYRAGLFDKAYVIAGAIAALSICIVAEVSLTKAANWRMLAVKSLRFAGIELALLSIIMTVTQTVAGAFFDSFISGIAVVLPFLIGCLFITTSIIMRRRIS